MIFVPGSPRGITKKNFFLTSENQLYLQIQGSSLQISQQELTKLTCLLNRSNHSVDPIFQYQVPHAMSLDKNSTKYMLSYPEFRVLYESELFIEKKVSFKKNGDFRSETGCFLSAQIFVTTTFYENSRAATSNLDHIRSFSSSIV